MEAIIQVKGLSKTFGDKHALKDINLDITNGSMTALLGPSGSGKSTLLRHLSGLVYSDKDPAAQVSVLGSQVQAGGKASKQVRQCRARAGYIFQQFNLVNRLTVMTNVLVGALNQTPWWRTLSGQFTREQQMRALQALERVGMAAFAQQRVSTLSGGQQQRVAIARALMQDAKIIFADEPIASLDPESSRIVMELLKDINQREGIPVIVTLHQVDYAKSYSDHIIALRAGEVFFDGPSEQCTQEVLDSIYTSQSQTPQATQPVGIGGVGLGQQPAYNN
ncbi:phosphonate ABC transporter ATP-binding protein [Aliagarivorans taiwanensis]|uniref:phosphonate ABC transporter ATP-binding protein n=1 Tax=Aliagarivorans taiwanensis TaxID=561966 RepID=UPI00040F234A|nr:phosphonate ABC transporter ATP-binding protein [Aliagarivorans taiwanensis]